MSEKRPSKRVLDICDETLALPQSERETFLANACGTDSRLRASVDSVLLAVEQAGDFLDVPAGQETELQSLDGKIIGNYHLQRKLGEGGMGSVYLAERREADFSQRVAIKLVRGHLLARELIERFHAERELLARLNHPYIANLIDSGTTEEGVPYLVMEYVDGVPIDEYCDSQCLNLRKRLELIQKVAMAVQAAHRNLIVHRDLKPSNVLVTSDGIPKLLDFGIAKLIEPDGVLDSSATAVFGNRALTPDYASPEQILDGTVTTASDVYSLGVLSYQLLTGERPYHLELTSQRELLDSVERLTVPKPSSKLDTIDSNEDRDAIARRRATTPARLGRSLRGDLDNILLMALRQEPERRYPSVAQFSDDIQRYLKGMPVQARGDGWGYRSGKFLRRNWLPVGAAAVVLISLGAGIVGFAWQAREAQHQRDVANEEAATARGALDFITAVLWAANPFDSGQSEATIDDALRYAEGEIESMFGENPRVRAFVLASLSEVYQGRGEYAESERLSKQSIAIADDELAPDDSIFPYLLRIHANALHGMGEPGASEAALLDAIARTEKQKYVKGQEYAATYNQLGAVLTDLNRVDDSIAAYRRAIALHTEYSVDDPDQRGAIYNNLGASFLASGQLERAAEALSRSIEILDGLPKSRPRVATMKANLAGVNKELGRLDEAERLYLEAIEIQKATVGSEHPESVMTRTSLGQFFSELDQLDRARDTLVPALADARQGLPEDHPIIAYVAAVTGKVLCQAGDVDRGIELTSEAVRIRTEFYPEGHWAIASAQSNLALCHWKAGNYAQAEALLLPAIETIGEARGRDHLLVQQARDTLREVYKAWGRPEDAEALADRPQ